MGYNRKDEWYNHLDFMMLDIILMFGALLAANVLRNGMGNPFESSDFRRLMAVTMILYLCIVFFMDPYMDIIKRGYLMELKCVWVTNTLILFTLFTYLFAIQMTEYYSRVMIGYFYILNTGAMYMAHCMMKHIIRRRTVEDKNKSRMLLATKREFVQHCVNQLMQNPYSSNKVIGIILLDGAGEDSMLEGVPVIGGQEALIPYCKEHVVDEVLFFVHDLKIGEMVQQLSEMGIVIHRNIIQHMDDRLQYNVNAINGILTLTTSINYATTWQITVKRLVDIVGGMVGCLLTGLIALLIAPIIKIQSPGPIFFSQVRVGKNGRLFKIYKFRSMYTDAEERKKELMEHNKVEGLMFKMENDPRIFPFGHFIRKTSLDEFPQFWNILKGEMSLVGTRPPTVDEWERYELHHHRRLSVKPGLTGMWQVSGRSNITDFEQVVELDTKYISEWSLGLDLKILARTLIVVWKREGSV